MVKLIIYTLAFVLVFGSLELDFGSESRESIKNFNDFMDDYSQFGSLVRQLDADELVESLRLVNDRLMNLEANDQQSKQLSDLLSVPGFTRTVTTANQSNSLIQVYRIPRSETTCSECFKPLSGRHKCCVRSCDSTLNTCCLSGQTDYTLMPLTSLGPSNEDDNTNYYNGRQRDSLLGDFVNNDFISLLVGQPYMEPFYLKMRLVNKHALMSVNTQISILLRRMAETLLLPTNPAQQHVVDGYLNRLVNIFDRRLYPDSWAFLFYSIINACELAAPVPGHLALFTSDPFRLPFEDAASGRRLLFTNLLARHPDLARVAWRQARRQPDKALVLAEPAAHWLVQALENKCLTRTVIALVISGLLVFIFLIVFPFFAV